MSRIGDSKVARRYAGALFDYARRTGKVDVVQRDLETIRGLLAESPLLQRSLESPLVPAERKNAIVDDLFKQDLDPLTLSFLHLLIHKRREQILSMVDEEFRRLADEDRGLVRARAIVALPMNDSQRSALVSSLERRTGKRIELDTEVNPVILGGVVVRMEDKIIDGSVRGALERIREQMLLER